MSYIAQIFYDLVVNGHKTIDEVPLKWKSEVQAELDKQQQ